MKLKLRGAKKIRITDDLEGNLWQICGTGML